MKSARRASPLIAAIPVLLAVWAWTSALAFIPVPWPDDSAFYFVAREFFKWPPRWVMLPQAPFEPTYRVFQYNTMPIYPLLIGFGRWLGIDGTFALKFWPLSAWAASGSLLCVCLYRRGLPVLLASALAVLWGLDPSLRWASVLIRPESLIGLCGMGIVLGLTFGFPDRLDERRFWDPVAALLALGAGCHFNAVHLLFPVIFGLILQPRRLLRIALRTSLYLSPWIVMVLMHPSLFLLQMRLQWGRLQVGNDWLTSPAKAIESVHQWMGSPESFPKQVEWAALGIWILILTAVVVLLGHGFSLVFRRHGERRALWTQFAPSAGWVIGAVWLWQTKPEVWFTYYIHASVWTFAGILLTLAWRSRREWGVAPLAVLTPILIAVIGIYAFVSLTLERKLSASPSWNWATYHRLIDCVDQQLSQLEHDLGSPRPFRVWDPTFPDITIELSRRHPEWELTRTNDFYNRADLAIRHGHEVEAVVVPETIGFTERNLSGPLSKFPEVQSAWLTWQGYFLYRLWSDPNWKPHNRYLCQIGRWQAFIFMKDLPTTPDSAIPPAP